MKGKGNKNIVELNEVVHEYYEITPHLRYVEKDIDIGNGDVKTEIRLQQMWQGSMGSQKWIDVELAKENK